MDFNKQMQKSKLCVGEIIEFLMIFIFIQNNYNFNLNSKIFYFYLFNFIFHKIIIIKFINLFNHQDKITLYAKFDFFYLRYALNP